MREHGKKLVLPAICLQQRVFGLHPIGDVLEQHRHLEAVAIRDPEREHIEPPVQRLGFVDEADRLPGLCDAAIDLVPVRLVRGSQLPHGLALRIHQPGLHLEAWIDLAKTVVERMPVFVEQHFDDAKAFIDRREQRAVAFFTSPQRGLGHLPVMHVGRGAEPAGDLSGLRIAMRFRAHQEPAIVAMRRADAMLDAIDLARANGELPGLDGGCLVVGMHEFRRDFAGGGARRVPCVDPPLLVEIHGAPRVVHDPDDLRNRVRHQAKPQLTFAELFFDVHVYGMDLLVVGNSLISPALAEPGPAAR